ncbi:MAG: DUF3524 domain-containing protein, partial [Lewinellaceae bacterium]|nr:DUF3524 domain-containing protein [Lewinellaceae bacterium]
EPFLSGSHQKWAEGFRAHSRHDVRILSLKGRHWKWRMHGGAATLAEQFHQLNWKPGLILATDMLDVAAFLGLARQSAAHIPTATYFHENQITYPWSPADEDVSLQRDNHYGFINFTTALASGRIFFNSHFHLQSFLGGLPEFLKQFPDHHGLHRIEEIREKSEVLPLGLHLQELGLSEKPEKAREATLLWNHRWEYDKAPEVFFRTLFRLKEEGVPFRLIVLGRSYRKAPEIFEAARHRLKEEILHFGYAKSRAEYARLLWQADILPVTSRQDFFGGSVAEAIFCNCYPLLPNRLAYPEHIPEEKHAVHLYENEEELYSKLRDAVLRIGAIRERAAFRDFVARYDWSILVADYDKAFGQLAQIKPK